MIDQKQNSVRTNQYSNQYKPVEHIDLKGNNLFHYKFFKEKFDYELKAPDQVILELGNYDLKTRDLILLLRKNWLNDMIINYFGLILSNETFQEAVEVHHPDLNLYEKKFLILNTFVSINVGYLEKSYFEYKKDKYIVQFGSLSNSESEDSSFNDINEKIKNCKYKGAKDKYLK
jgi:hypothetical protein